MKSRAQWRLLTAVHFVDNEFISLNQSFMQKIRIRYIDCTATVQKIKFVYAQFRGTVTVKVALDHFLQIRKEVKIYVYEKLRIFFVLVPCVNPVQDFSRRTDLVLVLG